MATGGGCPLERNLDLAALFDDAVIGMAVVGLDGRFEAVNPALCRLLGYDEADLLGRHATDVTHPDDRPRSGTTLAGFVSGTLATDQVHKRYVRADGSVMSAVRTSNVIRDADGSPRGLVAQIVDVTALIDMQDAISRSEQRFKALVAHASDLILLVDADGRIRYASPGVGRVLGYRPAEEEGRSVFDLVHPDDQPRAQRLFTQHSSTPGAAAPVSYRVRHHDGSWREVEVVATNLFDDPSVAGLVLNVRDVTEQNEYRRQLQAGERRFHALVANAWDIISLHDAAGRYLFVSPAVSRLGYRPEQLVDTDPFERVHPDDQRAVLEVFRLMARGEQQVFTAEYRFRHGDGSWRWLESIAERRDDDGSVGTVVVTRDVTVARRRAHQQQVVAELGQEALRGGPVDELMAKIPAVVAEALAVPHCHLVRFEPDATRTVVASTDSDRRRQAGGDADCPVCTEVHERGRPVFWQQDGADPGHGRRDSDTAGGRDDTAGGCAAAAAVPVEPAAGPRGALAVCTPQAGGLGPDDLSFLETVASVLAAALSRRRVEVELRRQAVHDRLTDLPNRTLLEDRLRTALARLGRRGGAVAVCFVDVDDFKLINDSLGHSVGDAVVAAVAERLKAAVRSPDTVARFGGDEFVVVSESSDPADARLLAERLRQTVAAPLTVEAGTVALTASIGCATTADPTTSPDGLFADADMAMYEAKRTGKNRVALFTPALRRRTTDQLQAVSGIRRGLDAAEFCLYYQPVHSLAGGDVVGYEALVRWQHPTAGLLLPDQFLDHAETSGLIVPLGAWVLRTACAQSAAWRRAGRPAKVSVNVSGRQLTDGDVVAEVAAALSYGGADPDDISLEVTERGLISDRRARRTLDALHELGVHLGLDDFGTGWSSLSQLARLPFDFVKIDRSFVRDLRRDERTAALLESIVGLCATLGLHVIVEGVETSSQLDQLKQLDVRLVQGFLLGRPVPPEALA